MSSDSSWDIAVTSLKTKLEAMHLAREGALRQCRALIQVSSKCIKHVHRRQFEEATAFLEEGRRLANEARESLKSHPELLYAGYLQDAEKEMVEAAALLLWVTPTAPGDPPAHVSTVARVPSLEELGVSPVSYLNGLGEAASECRRYVLDELRKGSLAEAERLLGQMETIYDDLVTFDYPDALTGGLRRTCDALRAVIERTRSDLTMTRVQYDLMTELRKTQDRQVML